MKKSKIRRIASNPKKVITTQPHHPKEGVCLPEIRFDSADESGCFEDVPLTITNENRVVLNGQVFNSAEVEYPVAKSLQWRYNPRFTLDQVGQIDKDASDEELCLILLQSKDVQNLVYQMLSNGGVPKPLLGIPRSDGTVEIADGSCRLLGLKLGLGLVEIPDTDEFKSFRKKYYEERERICEERNMEQPFADTVPVRVLIDAEEKDILAAVAFEHVNGSRGWPPEMKGAYAYSMLQHMLELPSCFECEDDLVKLLKDLDDKKNEAFDCLKSIGTVIGETRPDRVRVLIITTATTMFYNAVYNHGKNGKSKWDHFRRMHKDARLKALFKGEATIYNNKEKGESHTIQPVENFAAKFMSWLASNRITDTVDIQHLPEVLSDKNAKAKAKMLKTKKGTLKEAIRILENADNSDSIQTMVSDCHVMAENLESLNAQDIAVLSEQPHADQILENLYNSLNSVIEKMNS